MCPEPIKDGQDILFVVNSTFGHRKMPGYRPFLIVSRSGVEPRVFARGCHVPYSRIEYPLPLRSLLARGLNAVRIKFWPKLPSRQIERTVFDWCCLLRSRMLSQKPSLVHFWDALPLTMAYWRKQNVPVILDMQMAHPNSYDRLLKLGLVDAAYGVAGTDPVLDLGLSLADLIICPSLYVKESLPPQLAGRGVVVPFGADVPPQEKKITTGSKRPVRVLFTGNINYRKGIPFLLEAWRRLDTRDAELILCGRVAREAGPWIKNAPANVFFVGYQEDLHSYWNNADVFVLPTLMEGSSKAVYEAMAHGLPVVVTSHAGSVVTSGDEGFVVPPADPSALASALERLLADEQLRHEMGNRGRQQVSNYTWNRYADDTVALYPSLLKFF